MKFGSKDFGFESIMIMYIDRHQIVGREVSEVSMLYTCDKARHQGESIHHRKARESSEE